MPLHVEFGRIHLILTIKYIGLFIEWLVVDIASHRWLRDLISRSSKAVFFLLGPPIFDLAPMGPPSFFQSF